MQIDGVKVTYAGRAPDGDLRRPAGRGRGADRADASRDRRPAREGHRARRLARRPSALRRAVPESGGRPRARTAAFAANDAGRGAGRRCRGGVGAAAEGLVESGIAMAMFGNSRPASGCEHHASHFWDLLAARGRRAHASHGLQVGYATRLRDAAAAVRVRRTGVALGRRSRRPTRSGGGARVARRAVRRDRRRGRGEAAVAVSSARRGRGRRWLGGGPRRARPTLALFDAVGAGLDAAGIPADAGLARDRRRDAAGDLPLREPPARALHDDRLPRRPGPPRRGDRGDACAHNYLLTCL